MNTQLASALMVLAVLTAVGCAPKGSSDNSSGAANQSAIAAGPAGYHNEYSKIQHTNVTIQNFDVRTEEGDVIHIATDKMSVDLQALSGFTQGLVLDLTNVEFPGGAQEIHVAEIQTTVVKSDGGNIQSSDGTSCDLKSLPEKLNLYTSAAITLGHDIYHVKVGYTALNSIQLDEVSVTECKKKCSSKASLTGKHGHHGRDHDDDDDDDGHCSNPTVTVTRECKLVNRRQPVSSIVRAIDDAF